MAAPDRRDLLTLTMIVKDEEATISRTLRSVKPFVDRWLIADTGSTDATIAVVRQAMDGVPGAIVALPFVDFARARNAALDACGAETTFVLWLDAEDELTGGAALREFLAAHAARRAVDHEAYSLRVTDGVAWSSTRVLRSDAGWRFTGAVHEVLTRPGGSAQAHRIPGAQIVHHRAHASLERSRRRWERDVGLLEQALSFDPRDARAAFYLGRTFAALGRAPEAMEAYRRRVALGGWEEEIYQARFGLAAAAEAANHPWSEALTLYLEAYAAAPHRAEPLHAIARHYSAAGEHALAVLFARRGLDLPYPEGDQLFVDEDVYRFQLFDLYAASAYWIGDFEIGEHCAREALKARPGDARVVKNLEFYLARKEG